MLVSVGDTVNLRCPISSHSSDVDWAKANHGSNSSVDYEMIAVDCAVQPGYTSLYQTGPDTAGSCNLVIQNVGGRHGGRYVCYNAAGVMSEEIFLTVLGKCRSSPVSVEKCACWQAAFVIYATADEAVAYVLQMFFFSFLFFSVRQKYETTVLGNG